MRQNHSIGRHVVAGGGDRVNSLRATQFRIWATNVLKEFIIKGFALDDNRLKKGNNPFGEDYFRELLERIRSIRASERRIVTALSSLDGLLSSLAAEREKLVLLKRSLLRHFFG